MGKFTAQEVLDEIERQAPIYGLEPRLAQAFFHAENSADGQVDPKRIISGATTSRVGARGVMQTMPDTEIRLKESGFLPKEWQFSPADLRGQVQAGLAALQEMRTRQKNKDDPLELAAMYNGGTVPWQNYRAGLVDKIPAETRNYFTKIRTALGGGRPDMTPQQMEAQVKTAPAAGGSSPESTVSSNRQSSSVRSSSYDPAMFAATLNQGFEIIKSGGSADAAAAIINKSSVERQAAEQAQLMDINARAQAQGAAVTAETAVSAQAAARRAQILTTAGINPDIANNMANRAFDTIINNTAELEVEGAEIDARQAVGIFDNPLQWLINQTRLPGMVGSYNQKARQTNRAVEAAQTLQGLASTQISLSQAVDADLITKAGAAKSAEVAARAQEEANQVRQAIAGNAVRDAVLGQQLAGQKFQTAVTLTELTKQVRSENTAMSEREAEKRAQEIQLERVNKWLKMIGSANQFDSATFKSLPTKTREDLLLSAGTGRISNNLYDGITAVQNYGNSRTMAAEGDAGTVAWLTATVAAAKAAMQQDLKLAQAQAKVSGKPVKEEEFLKQSVDKLQEVYQAEAVNMRTASDSNPIKISYDTLLKDPVAGRNPVAEFIRTYGPMSPTPVFTKIDEKLILDKFVADVRLGKVPVGDAASAISAFYKAGVDQQIRVTKYPLFGIDTPLNGYTVSIPASGVFDKPMAGGTVDLTNPAAVESYLIKNVAVQARAMAPMSLIPPVMDPMGINR